MTVEQLHRFIGSHGLAGTSPCVRQVHSACSVHTEVRETERVTVFHTPVGELREMARFDPVSRSWHPVAFPVSDVEQVKVMTAFYRDMTVAPDAEAAEQARRRCGPDQQDAVTWAAMTLRANPIWTSICIGIPQYIDEYHRHPLT
ncbi:MAG: hypothetical protein GF331_04520 [Chitinivibrionales bacterium]|nr:hypothetical protein [Chitinivibrionales bacterium]